MNALKAQVRETGEPLDHTVMKLLADQLQIPHATLFQVSTSVALVEGVSQGVVTVGELKRHGNFGLGTFANLDGEMVVADGKFWRVPAIGHVHEAKDSDLVPFAVITTFKPERTIELASVTSFQDLSEQLDKLRNSNNLFFAVRIDGNFRHVHSRAVAETDAGHLEDAVVMDAITRQAEFDFLDTAGTIVGFWTPQYAKTINISGWHMHFLTADRFGGGHLLDTAGDRLKVQIQHLDDFRMAIPENPEFLKADLTHDPSKTLDKVEHWSASQRVR